MADADDFYRGETLDIFLGMLDASQLDHLFEGEMDNIRRCDNMILTKVRNHLKRSIKTT